VSACSAPASVLILAWFLVMGAGAGQTLASDISTLAPTADDLDGWTPVGDPEQYEGLDLYELINGGAEVYHEYGFRRVLAQEYGDGANRYIAVEIYEMESAAAAFGIY